MESRISELQEKYWAGETSVEEEKILKDYFNKKESESIESAYFKHLKKSVEQKPPREFKLPARKVSLPKWMMAAAITIGILAGGYIWQVSQKQNEFLVEDPQKAMEITRQALMTISSGMSKGSVYVDNIKKIDNAKQMVKHKTEPAFNSGFFINNF